VSAPIGPVSSLFFPSLQGFFEVSLLRPAPGEFVLRQLRFLCGGGGAWSARFFHFPPFPPVYTAIWATQRAIHFVTSREGHTDSSACAPFFFSAITSGHELRLRALWKVVCPTPILLTLANFLCRIFFLSFFFPPL